MTKVKVGIVWVYSVDNNDYYSNTDNFCRFVDPVEITEEELHALIFYSNKLKKHNNWKLIIYKHLDDQEIKKTIEECVALAKKETEKENKEKLERERIRKERKLKKEKKEKEKRKELFNKLKEEFENEV